MRHSNVVTSGDRVARAIVWSVWTSMLVLLVWSMAPVISRVPLAEDWFLVAPFTGHEPDVSAWLWAQTNEHRTPLARLILLGTITIAHGDFRVGGYLNAALLAATAAALIVLVRRIRGGGTKPADAVFPLLLMHFGHSHQVLFTWLLLFVAAAIVTIAAGCALHTRQSVASPQSAAAAGITLLLLPLCGLNGLLFVPALAAFLLYAGWACWFGARNWPARRGMAAWLISSSLGTLVLTALYFVGYQQPWWNPPSPGVVPSFKTALKVLSLGFGAAPEFWWAPFVIASVALYLASLWRAFRNVIERSAAERDFAIGAALFLANAIAFAWVLGWARAAYVPQFGIPTRYVLAVTPAVIASYLTWEVSGSKARDLVQRSLAIALLFLVPVNTVAGHRFFADWYRDGMSRLERDINAGMPVRELAIRHQPFLVHWWTPAVLEQHMRWLHDARVPPFDRMNVEDAASRRK
jgi:hypothetical protein